MNYSLTTNGIKMKYEPRKLVTLTVKVWEDQADYFKSHKGYNRLLRDIIDNSEFFKIYKQQQAAEEPPKQE